MWLGYRASSLLILPVDHVIKLLNLDVPPAPNVALDSVTSGSISLRWHIPDKQSASKFIVQLNGAIIGESDKKDTNVIVTGLNPDQLYCVRVIASNSQGLHSASEIIRVQTTAKPKDAPNAELHGTPILDQLIKTTFLLSKLIPRRMIPLLYKPPQAKPATVFPPQETNLSVVSPTPQGQSEVAVTLLFHLNHPNLSSLKRSNHFPPNSNGSIVKLPIYRPKLTQKMREIAPKSKSWE